MASLSQRGDSPVTPHFPPELLGEPLEVLGLEVGEPRVVEDHPPGHDGGDFAVQFQSPTEVEQRGQVGLAKLPRPCAGTSPLGLSRVWVLPNGVSGVKFSNGLGGHVAIRAWPHGSPSTSLARSSKKGMCCMQGFSRLNNPTQTANR